MACNSCAGVERSGAAVFDAGAPCASSRIVAGQTKSNRTNPANHRGAIELNPPIGNLAAPAPSKEARTAPRLSTCLAAGQFEGYGLKLEGHGLQPEGHGPQLEGNGFHRLRKTYSGGRPGLVGRGFNPDK